MSVENGIEPVVDATVIEESPRQEVVRRDPPMLSVTPQVQAAELVERLEMIRQAQSQAMKRDVDFGVIPGTDKPTLFKPGAEKLSVLFQLDVQIVNEKTWGPDDHLTVVSKATVYHAPTGSRLGFGEGVCTTREKKYAKRRADPKCPSCGKENIRKSKKDDGFYCWAKTGGCGGTFPADDQRITSQPVGEIDNPDLPDLWNTVVKMAEKRARIDAVLAVTGASALFTQDMDDHVERADSPAPQQSSEPPASNGSRVTARPAQSTERMASARQRGLMNARASDKGLPPTTLANIVLAASESAPREFASQSDAEDWLRRSLDRLPMRLVNPILEGIEKAPQEATA